MNDNRNNNRKIAYCGIFVSLAIILSWVELVIQLPIFIPGIKLGLANIVTLIVMYYFNTRIALIVSIIRIIVCGILFSGFSGFLYSLSGAILSITIMIISKDILKLSIYTVSILGGISHNIGQIFIASLVVKTNFSIYVPILIISGFITGILIGIIAKNIINIINK